MSRTVESSGAKGSAPAVTLRGLDALRERYRFTHEQLDTIIGLHDKHGPVVILDGPWALRRLLKPLIFTYTPDLNRQIYSDTRSWRSARLTLPGPANSPLRRLGDNLVNLYGDRHRYYRKLLSPPMQKHRVEQMSDEIGRRVEQQVDTWPRGRVDLWPLACKLMRSLAIGLLFGDDQPRGFNISKLLEKQLRLNSSLFIHGFPFPVPGTRIGCLLTNAEELEHCTLEFAATKRGDTNPNDLLSLIVNSPDEHGHKVDDARIAGHLPILLGASHETCQTLLTWTLMLLAQHPPVARDLIDEIRGVLGGAPATLKRVDDLPLLEAVIKESMRLLPPIPYQYRVAMFPVELGGMPIAESTRVILSPFMTNRIPSLYPEPRRFRPERWATINPSPFEYLTFSAGPRSCPGLWFGKGVVKVALATVLSRFSVRLVPNAKIDRYLRITMAPRGGMPVVLGTPDEPWASAPITGQIARMFDMPAAGQA